MPAKICKAAATSRRSMSASQSEYHTDNNDMQPTENGNTNFGFHLSEQRPLVVCLPPQDTLRSDQTTLPSGQRSQPRPTCAVKPFQATVSLSVEVREDEAVLSKTEDKTAKKHTNSNSNISTRKTNRSELSEKVKERLSKASYYHGRLSTLDARVLLKNEPVGTFLVRDSESPNHVFSISSRTSRGTTSVRVSYDVKQQTFELDVGGFTNSGKPVAQSPRFNCITAIVDYLIRVSTGASGEPCLCVESNGRSDTPFLLLRPLPSSSVKLL